MAYARIAGNIIIDNAHADGLITVHGIGRDWPAQEPREDAGGFSPDVAGQYGWIYNDQFEYLPTLGGIAPVAILAPDDMDIDDWTLYEGTWRETSSGGTLRNVHLHCVTPPGWLRSKTSLSPNLAIGIWRMATAYGQTQPPMVEIHLGNGGGVEYAICLPALGPSGTAWSTLTGAAGQMTGPTLLGKPAAESHWTVIDRIKAGTTPQLAHIGAEPVYQWLRIEYVAQTLIVYLDSVEEPWHYSGEWQTRSGAPVAFSLTDGVVDVHVSGHQAAFQVVELEYPTSAVLRPQRWFVTGDRYNQTPAYRTVAYQESGGTLSVAAETGATTQMTRPVVTFVGDGTRRAVLYNIQEYREPTIGGAVSNPLDTYNAPTFKLIEMNGETCEGWRGSSVNAVIQALPGYTLNDVDPNAKVTAQVSVDGGASYTTLFTGYVPPPEKLRQPGVRPTQAHLEAVDIIEGRLRRKCMHWHCSYGGWPIPDAWEHFLHRLGVPDALIDIDADISAAIMGSRYYLPLGSMPAERKLAFSPDADPVTALDAIAESRALEWGVWANGVIFLRPTLTHTAGHYDWTLNAATTTIEDIVATFRSSRTVQDFVNLLVVMVGEGQDAAAQILVDEDSMSNASSRRFIGDVWSRFVAMPNADSVAAIAARIWDEVSQWHHLVQWTMRDCPHLMPDDEVRVQVAGVEVPNNSVFRITRKAWRCGADGLYEQTLDAVIVEEGA